MRCHAALELGIQLRGHRSFVETVRRRSTLHCQQIGEGYAHLLALGQQCQLNLLTLDKTDWIKWTQAPMFVC